MYFIIRATRFGKVAAVEILLEQGASVNVINATGATPLHLACEYGQFEIVKVILVFLIVAYS